MLKVVDIDDVILTFNIVKTVNNWKIYLDEKQKLISSLDKITL